MNLRAILNVLGLFAIAAALGLGPATGPATKADLPGLTVRQQSLLMQLADAEANIQAINKALKLAGYKVGMAYDQIDSQRKASELMDRKGGGPVRWDAFYGKTAREYGTNFWGDKQPEQFKFIYKANNDRITQAQQQIADLSRNQSALLDRRRKHEADQSALWAKLAWEQVRNREISDEPICRYALKGAGGNGDGRTAMLRAFVLFLRSADKLANQGLDVVDRDQDAAFAMLDPWMKAAYGTLRSSLADISGADTLAEPDRTRADRLKVLCKRLSDECSVIADDYRNALDRDKAKEDDSKLAFRGKLQESLATFAETVADLDVQTGDSARAWNVVPERSVHAPDLGQIAQAPSLQGDAGAKWINLLDPTHIGQWTNGVDGEKASLELFSGGFVRINAGYFWGTPIHDGIIRARVHKRSGQSLAFLLRRSSEGSYGAWFNGGNEFGIGINNKEKKWTTLATGKSRQPFPGPFMMTFSAVGDELTLSADGAAVVTCRDTTLKSGLPGIGALKGESDFNFVQLQILDAKPPR